ncbi:unnamed protein product [Pleuronectes platessa]|uniref:Uncharacterized protein n=1 Tax=Pleuronectes platessa TaxID=8262 RepID=A0A9N7YNQ3_PLEPL|nr:unnamed protein product [Pleuronectes platessa]
MAESPRIALGCDWSANASISGPQTSCSIPYITINQNHNYDSMINVTSVLSQRRSPADVRNGLGEAYRGLYSCFLSGHGAILPSLCAQPLSDHGAVGFRPWAPPGFPPPIQRRGCAHIVDYDGGSRFRDRDCNFGSCIVYLLYSGLPGTSLKSTLSPILFLSRIGEVLIVASAPVPAPRRRLPADVSHSPTSEFLTPASSPCSAAERFSQRRLSRSLLRAGGSNLTSTVFRRWRSSQHLLQSLSLAGGSQLMSLILRRQRSSQQPAPVPAPCSGLRSELLPSGPDWSSGHPPERGILT